MRTHADNLTIAYIASGVRMALTERPTDPDWEAGGWAKPFNPDDWDGELNFMDRIINDALLLDKVADGFEDHPCVWVYEVAEEYGFIMANVRMDEPKGTPDRYKILHMIMKIAGYDEKEFKHAYMKAIV